MNILPKKRWHVRNQDNKERVRKDEENARLEVEKEEERILLAEQEARLSLLRKKHGVIHKSSKEDSKEIVIQQKQTDHINLFADAEAAGNSLKKENEDHKKEKLKEKEDYEKKIGLLTYLGQSSAESKGKEERPWYLDNKKGELTDKQDNSGSAEKEIIRKYRLDPMSVVEKSLKKHKEKKAKKNKKEKKKDDKEKSPRRSSSTLSIEELREQRLKREREERAKANNLLHSLSADKSTNIQKNSESDPTRYSNQFNPGIARKRKYDRYNPY